MQDVISSKTAGIIALVLLGGLAVFHILVLAGIIPPIVWGGQAADATTMMTGELVSLFMTAVFMVIIALKAGFLWPGRFRMIASIGIWCMAAVFLLSTIGNLTSSIATEKLIFTPISIMLFVLAMRLGMAHHQ